MSSILQNPSILIQRSIADIREPESRESEWTKTIEIPGTSANNKIFSHLFEVEQTVYGTSFNPNVPLLTNTEMRFPMTRFGGVFGTSPTHDLSKGFLETDGISDANDGKGLVLVVTITSCKCSV